MKNRKVLTSGAVIAACAAMTASGFTGLSSAAAAGEPFEMAWTDTFRGNMTQTGNTLIACDPTKSVNWLLQYGADACEKSMNFALAAQTGLANTDSNYAPSRFAGDPFSLAFYNHSSGVKAAANTPAAMVNSSSATLTIPAGSTGWDLDVLGGAAGLGLFAAAAGALVARNRKTTQV